MTKVNGKKFDWGEAEKPRLACPHCGPNYSLVDDDHTLHQLGFVKVLSENPDVFESAIQDLRVSIESVENDLEFEEATDEIASP